MVAPLLVYVRHVQSCGYCTRGARRWFEGRGLDFRLFIKNGIDADVLLATDDPMARAAVKKATDEKHG